MQKLRLEELLRYTLSGALFLIALVLQGPSIKIGSWSAESGLGEATKALGLVLLVGALIYSFHRAVLFPLILLPAALSLAALGGAGKFEWIVWRPLAPSRVEQQMDDDRFALRAQKDVLFEVWNEWGSQIHFLYCSAEGIFLALGTGHVLAGYGHRKMLACSAFILLAAGMLHHVRLLYRIIVVWHGAIKGKLSFGGSILPTERDAIAD